MKDANAIATRTLRQRRHPPFCADNCVSGGLPSDMTGAGLGGGGCEGWSVAICWWWGDATSVENYVLLAAITTAAKKEVNVLEKLCVVGGDL